MRVSRLAVGFVAGPVAIATGLALAYWESRMFGIIHVKLIPVLALAVGGGVFWLADRLDVLAEPVRTHDHRPEVDPEAGDRS